VVGGFDNITTKETKVFEGNSWNLRTVVRLRLVVSFFCGIAKLTYRCLRLVTRLVMRLVTRSIRGSLAENPW